MDLDNLWSYMMVHGDSGWEQYPSYLEVVVPRILETLRAHRLKITVFVVGQDAVLAGNRESLAAIATDGHEIGNHSFHHRPWMHKRSRPEIEAEIARAEQSIQEATGKRPVGFRGPGYSRSNVVLDVLAARGYRYDASPLSTWIGPLARAYYLRSVKLDADGSTQRDELFGRFADGWGPNRAFVAITPSGDLTVVPVTTMPLARIPIHVSYVLYLLAVSPAVAKRYVDVAFALCRATATEPSILLHPLDFVGPADAPELRFFPGMQFDAHRKRAMLDYVLDAMERHFNVMRMVDYVNVARPLAFKAAG